MSVECKEPQPGTARYLVQLDKQGPRFSEIILNLDTSFEDFAEAFHKAAHVEFAILNFHNSCVVCKSEALKPGPLYDLYVRRMSEKFPDNGSESGDRPV